MDSDGDLPREAEECGPSRWSARFPHDVTDVLMLANTAPQHPPQQPGHQSAVNSLTPSATSPPVMGDSSPAFPESLEIP